MRELWTCPRCNRRFVGRNHPHSCGPWTVDTVLAATTPEVRTLYDRFAQLATQAGEVAVAPAKTRIGFQARTIFAAVVPRRRWLDAHVVFERRLEHPRFRRIESFGPRTHLHAFRITAPEDLDDELGGWLREAYAGYGQGHSVTSAPRA